MPSGFGELTDQAHDLVSAGDLAGAQRLLADALTGADPRPANATPELAEAASLHARVLVALGEPHSARGWAAFAYAATTRLHGRADPRTVAAAATLAAVLHRVGSWSRAARLYQEVIIELTATDGPESLRVLAAHADLATVEYARGQCQVARDRLQDAWELHREVYGDGHPSGIKMLARLGSMQRDCGQFSEAHDNLALARELSRQHLAPDDPLTAQVAALARAAANPDHACADTPPVSSQDPVVPAARIPPPGDAPPAPQWPTDAPASPAAIPTQPTDSAPTWPTDSAPTWPTDSAATWPTDSPSTQADWPTDAPAAHHDWPADSPAAQADWPADSPAARADWPAEGEAAGAVRPQGSWPEPEWPAAEEHPVEGYHPSHGYHPAGQPAAGAASPVPTPRQPAEGPAGPPDDWWTAPATEEPAPYPDYGTTTANTPDPYADRATAVPPSVVGLTGPAPQAPGVYRLRRVDEPEQSTPSRLLPVPVRRTAPAPRQPNRMVPIIAAGVVVVLLGTAAVIAGMSRLDGGGSPGAPATSNAPGSAPATTNPDTSVSPGAPPTGLALRDNRDSVTLNWEYPAGSEGPVIISGGRAGQPASPFADLPAGTDSFVVYGLNRSLDYCFTVAVAWSTDVVARSEQVCTDRR
ncbi:tetratricopeptide repeat protein [Micromonospora zingiberis]|uniref:Tetratricopeptide repeat protein n=1 Tax=Micromonospora zingiberis TaxID=2053011 RepID=A0A4R0G7F6_9ACTN|nr:tetratricopeptide repeat protein [Micromonospora zingiberis]TCB92117.1 tetratricopeptide repeat protein [Micromonospora zingiberis]